MVMDDDIADEIHKIRIKTEMEESYLNYAMSVNVGRAIPDVRDGLKPVHRRILYSMKREGLVSSRPHKKSARIVGDVLGKYHPHGDQAVYDALVRMAQDFSLRHPLVDGQGNFGSIDGDEAAAMRYTEARLHPLAEEIMEDIDEDTVVFQDNYDGSLEEPKVMPAKVPTLLLNGASGIGVGLSTNIPPHNLKELAEGIKHLIDKPDATVSDLMKRIPAPDFPTGATIHGYDGVEEAYKEGKGRITLRAKVKIQELKRNKHNIIVKEIPYQVNKSRLLKNIAELKKDGTLDEISTLRDESDRDGIQVVLETKQGVEPDLALSKLYKNTKLETTFNITNIALVEGEPQMLDLKTMLQHYIDHRRGVIRRRTEKRLEEARDRAHILEGLLTALHDMNDVIEVIRSSEDNDEAQDELIEKFELSDEQASSILEMRLKKLTGLEREKLEDEHEEKEKEIGRLETILGDEQEILDMIKDDLDELTEKYGDERRTEIDREGSEIDVEDLIPDEKTVITITKENYVKRVPLDKYKKQRRGGVGVQGMNTKKSDHVEKAISASGHDCLLVFTDAGKVYWIDAHEIIERRKRSRGKPIVNFVPGISTGESVTSILPVKDLEGSEDVVFATEQGRIKRTELSKYSNPRSDGINAIKLEDGDKVVDTALLEDDEDVMMSTRKGYTIRFSSDEVRRFGRNTRGVIGVDLDEEDEVVSMTLVEDDDIVLVVTEDGTGKTTDVEEFSQQRRNGMGLKSMTSRKSDHKLAGVRRVRKKDTQDVIFLTEKGQVLRTAVRKISGQGRLTLGVDVMDVKDDDRITKVLPVSDDV